MKILCEVGNVYGNTLYYPYFPEREVKAIRRLINKKTIDLQDRINLRVLGIETVLVFPDPLKEGG
jgi:hypothetical protein